MKRRLLSLLLVFAMVLSMLPAAYAAEPDETDENSEQVVEQVEDETPAEDEAPEEDETPAEEGKKVTIATNDIITSAELWMDNGSGSGLYWGMEDLLKREGVTPDDDGVYTIWIDHDALEAELNAQSTWATTNDLYIIKGKYINASGGTTTLEYLGIDIPNSETNDYVFGKVMIADESSATVFAEESAHPYNMTYYYIDGSADEDKLQLKLQDAEGNDVTVTKMYSTSYNISGDTLDMSSKTQYGGLTVSGTDENGNTVLGKVTVQKLSSLHDTVISRATAGTLFSADRFESTDMDTASAVILLPENGSVIKDSDRPYLNLGSDWGGKSLTEVSISNSRILDYECSGYIVYLTPKLPGTTTVTLTSKGDSEDTVTFNVIVDGVLLTVDGGETQMIGLQRAASVVAGETVQLKAQSAENAYTWSSSDETIATVDKNGLVTGVKEGIVNITAETEGGKKASIIVTVYTDAATPYLQDLTIGDLSGSGIGGYFYERARDEDGNWLNEAVEGATQLDYTSFFEPVQREYGFYTGNGRASTGGLTFYPFYDESSYKLEIYHNGEEVASVASGVEKAISLGGVAGEHTVVLKLVDKEDASKSSQYTLHYWVELSTTGKVSASITPAERSANTGFKFSVENGSYTTASWYEGTVYAVNSSGTISTTTMANSYTASGGWGSNPYTASYQNHGYAWLLSDVEEFTLSIVGSNTAYSVNTQWTTPADKNTLPDGWYTYDASSEPKLTWQADEGEEYMTVYIRAVSNYDFYYEGWQAEVTEADGTQASTITDPSCSMRELRIYKLPYDGTEVGFTSVELSEGQFMTPAFFSGRTTAQAVIPADCTSVTVTMTVPDDVSFSGNAWQGTMPTKNDDGSWDGTISISGTSASKTYTIYKKVTEGDYTRTLQTSLTFTLSKPDDNIELLPDAVVDHLVPYSQYSNGRQTQYTSGREYGIYPERSLLGAAGWEGVTTLGNFGGHIVWKYDEPIKNTDDHAYGVDFCVYGNAYSSGYGSEAGQVWVSKDGETWYALAGSQHYEDTTIWDYEMTYEYTTSSTTFNWSDNYGNRGTWSNAAVGQEYPNPNIYALHDYGEDGEYKDITLSGVLIKPYSGTTITATGMFNPNDGTFGYVDCLASDPAYGTGGGGAAGNATLNPENPYAQTRMGSSFDISWAVDEHGQPVYLDEISYVKVQTAVFNNGGVMGESSTEVSTMLRVPDSETSKGVTDAPASIVISQANTDTAITLTAENFEKVEGANAYTANVNVGTLRNLLFTVNGAADDNIYVNNQYPDSGETTTRAYTVEANNGRVVRIIVQNGEKEPVFYYLNLTGEAQVDDAILAVEELIDAIGTVDRNSGSAITKARTAYDALTSAQKAVVGNYSVLVQAETDYAALTSSNVGTAEETITVTIAVEKFTLGQGYILEPTLVKVPEDTVVSQILLALLGVEKVNFTGSTTANFWLSYLGDDEEAVDIPEAILEKLGEQYHGIREYDNWLGEYDYTDMAGWMYSVNGEFPNVLAHKYDLEDGDVIRWQFSLYNYGDDVGADNSAWGGTKLIDTDKDDLTELVAEANALTRSAAFIAENPEYQEAMDVLTDWGSTQKEIDAAYDALLEAMEQGDYGSVKAQNLSPKADQSNKSSLSSKSDEEKAEAVEELIDKIGTVTEDSGSVISAARKAYDRLTDAQKKLVSNYAELTAAESVYAQLTMGVPFTDVTGHWALEGIQYVYEEGLMNGTSATTFSPERTTTRGMIAAILYRLEGSPAVSGKTSFTDVPADMYYADAIQWAEANGVVTGYGNGTFGPDKAITRQQMAAILYRYAAYKKFDVSKRADLSKFTDADKVASYAVDALAWANAESLVNGTSADTLSPNGSATRAQVSMILMRYLENIVK